jgi:type IV secretory pathway VirB2 component (pilin)
MSTTCTRIVTALMLLALLFLYTEPALAQFTGGGTAAKGWLVQILTPVVGIAVLFLFFMCLAGKAQWGLFALAVVGIVGFYGHEQAISMVRGWFAV